MIVALTRLIEHARKLSAADGAALFLPLEPDRAIGVVGVGLVAGLEGVHELDPDSLVRGCLRSQRLSRCARLDGVTEAVRRDAERFGIQSWLLVPVLGTSASALGVMALVSAREDAFPESIDSAMEIMAGVVASSLADLTEAERAQAEARATIVDNESRFRAFMSALPAVAWVKDERGRHAFTNERFARLWKLSASFLEGKTDSDIFAPDVAEAMGATDAIVRRERRVVSVEEEVPTPDGARHFWWTTKFPIVVGDARIEVGGVAIDITERKVFEQALRASEAELRRSEANLRSVMEHLADGVLLHRDGVVLYANATAAAIVADGQTAGLLGRDLRDFIEPEDWSKLEVDTTSSHSVTTVIGLRRGQSDEGPTTLVESHASPINYEGAAAVVVILRDVTERLAREQRQQMTERLASVGTLAATVAHEINNPLAILITSLELIEDRLAAMREGPSNEDRYDVLSMTRDATAGAERIRRIVRAMRMLARDSAREKLLPMPLDRAIQAALQLTTNEIRHRARLVVELAATPFVSAHETGLTQVFVNLLSNAAQAIEAGAPENHTVRVTTKTSATGQAVIEVSDDGAGMTAQAQKRIFDPFFTTKAVGVGMGLGLSIVHGIVHSFGGDITVESEVGRGTTFRVTFPPAAAQVQIEEAGERESARHAPSRARARILIVDDEAALANLLARSLGAHETIVATSGAEALAKLADHQVDVVLCDVMMPGMDGIALFAEIEQRHPSLVPRVVFMSGGAFTATAQSFLERVPNRRLDKPLDLAEIESVIATLLDAGDRASD